MTPFLWLFCSERDYSQPNFTNPILVVCATEIIFDVEYVFILVAESVSQVRDCIVQTVVEVVIVDVLEIGVVLFHFNLSLLGDESQCACLALFAIGLFDWYVNTKNYKIGVFICNGLENLLAYVGLFAIVCYNLLYILPHSHKWLYWRAGLCLLCVACFNSEK